VDERGSSPPVGPLKVLSAETKVDAKPVTGSDSKVAINDGTHARRINGDNVREYRQRVSPMRGRRRTDQVSARAVDRRIGL
jgi:hypothetical protein